ncbi:molybdenum cofactor guanylyltransferase MobA [Xanthobacter tagetidis]|uniref:Molybdenum cofactor guanylyltransferase n=1 Tax=Xanthobacter tagetidis TaxID=60216 RepID=A0A3L7AEK9_9HYPH|nr:molybdenum cofactor guanylyltransferase MobA [Xanthobacter tagetidis]MBB6309842.1 molybdopterin-guanine dinucleotide biosynthesis protein A [Xanthobacter tagetidis]RLP78138.1 molybdenum cofactor guanylyltransferase [Xanthobacter tagetidis]
MAGPTAPPYPSDAASPGAAPAGTPVIGLILAGGHGSRMGAPALGAATKPMVLLGGRPLAAHVAERLAPQVARLYASGNDAEALAPLGLPVLPDPLPGRPGPLAGVLAGLDLIASQAPGALLLTAPADAPFLPADLAARLLAGLPEGGGPACAASAGRRHPVIALWPAALRDRLRLLLEGGERRVGFVIELLGGAAIAWPDRGNDPFYNVNSPQELEIARSRLSAHS